MEFMNSCVTIEKENLGTTVTFDLVCVSDSGTHLCWQWNSGFSKFVFSLLLWWKTHLDKNTGKYTGPVNFDLFIWVLCLLWRCYTSGRSMVRSFIQSHPLWVQHGQVLYTVRYSLCASSFGFSCGFLDMGIRQVCVLKLIHCDTLELNV